MGQNAKERLMEIFTTALEKDNANFVYVQIKMAGFEGKELIINPRENFQKKMEYYVRAYNKDLELKVNPNIQITAYGWAESFEDIDYYVNDRKSEVSLAYAIDEGKLKSVEKVFKHRSDADEWAKSKNNKGFVSHYVETHEVSRCGQTII